MWPASGSASRPRPNKFDGTGITYPDRSRTRERPYRGKGLTRMRVLLLLLTLVSGTNFAASQTNSPLNPNEGRQILGQLLELRSVRDEVTKLDAYIARDKEADEREKELAARALALEKKATEIAEAERDLAREKAELYEGLYKAIAKGPSVGCRIARALTVGIYRCN
jgi:hypothetical protein